MTPSTDPDITLACSRRPVDTGGKTTLRGQTRPEFVDRLQARPAFFDRVHPNAVLEFG